MENRGGGLILTRCLVALFVASTLSLGVGARPALAASPAITILRIQVTNSFPAQLAFEVQAQGTAAIDSIRLAYRIGDDPINIVDTATFTPGNRVDATRALDLQQEYVPPGVILHFRWLIQDASGAEVDTPWADFTVVDRRFLWHQGNQGGVVLHWYAGTTQFTDAVLSSAATALATAQRDAGTTSTTPVDVYLYNNDQDFRSSIGAGSSSWVGGLTYPNYHEVILLAPSTDAAGAQRSVAHEMTHVAVDVGSDSSFGPLPTWLDEGMAMAAEGQTDPIFTQALQSAAVAHHLMSIQSISGNFPDAPDAATLAYAESDSLVRYFTQVYGKNKLGLLIAGFRQGETADEAFQQSIGETTLPFQQGWLASLGQPAGIASPTASTAGNSVFRVLTAPIDFVVRLVGDALHKLQAGKSASLTDPVSAPAPL